ncbi:MAG: hypothetical protein KDK27_13095 [Leptospiraceae bacterium]|nr:hypothetical protein [Leptospiraceae bacterium]
MNNTEKIEAMLNEIAEQIHPALEQNTIYFAKCVNNGTFTSGGRFYFVKDGQFCFDHADRIKATMRELSPSRRLSRVTRLFPDYSKIVFQIEKGGSFTYRRYDVPMLLNDILLEFEKRSRNLNAKRIESMVEFTEKNDIQLYATGSYENADGVQTNDFAIGRQDLGLLYHALNRKMRRLLIRWQPDQIEFYGDPAFPEHNIAALDVGRYIPDLTDASFADLVAHLESGDVYRIRAAIEYIQHAPELTAQAWNRYGSFVRTRLNREDASFSDFAGAALSRAELATMNKFFENKDFLDFAYMNDDDSELVVTLIGNVIAEAVDIAEFINAAVRTHDESELNKLYNQYAESVKAHLLKVKANHPDGWYARLCRYLLDGRFEKVLFDHSKFRAANASPVLREFWFSVNLNHTEAVYLDIHQSETPDLSEIFWLLPAVPTTNWSDVPERFPESPLSFQRTGSTRGGDSYPWQTLRG